jgi:hypothetical protein
VTPVVGYYEHVLYAHEHPEGRIGFVCTTCNRPVDDTPCPEHAPTEVPGLVRALCAAVPPHHWWTLAADDHVRPVCPQCGPHLVVR